MLATLSPDTRQLFQSGDADKQLREQQLKLGMGLALGFSLLVHFFLLLFVFPAFSIDPSVKASKTKEPIVLELSLVEKVKELPAITEPEEVEEVVESPALTESRIDQSPPIQEQTSEESNPLLFPSKPDSPSTDMQAERIFDPRLRQQFYNTRPGSRNNEVEAPVEIHGSQYYDLGNGECLREMDSHGITSRDSEEFLIYNVRKVACPGAVSEGEAMIKGLKAALGRSN